MTVLEEGLAAKAKLGLLDTTTEEFIFLEDLEFLENDFTDLHSAITDSRGISWVANRSPKVILKEEGVVDQDIPRLSVIALCKSVKSFSRNSKSSKNINSSVVVSRSPNLAFAAKPSSKTVI